MFSSNSSKHLGWVQNPNHINWCRFSTSSTGATARDFDTAQDWLQQAGGHPNGHAYASIIAMCRDEEWFFYRAQQGGICNLRCFSKTKLSKFWVERCNFSGGKLLFNFLGMQFKVIQNLDL